jgi:hypothetical protein
VDGQVFDMLPALLQPHHQLLLLRFSSLHLMFAFYSKVASLMLSA